MPEDRQLTVNGDQGSPGQSAGTCFGFAVHSSLAFEYLRHGDGEPLTVSEPSRPPEGEPGELVQRWWRTTNEPFETSLYRDGACFRVEMTGSSWFHVDPQQASVAVPEDANTVRREERLWGLPAILCFLARGDVQLHAVAVEIDGGAVVIAAPQFHGKTTIAVTFHNAGLRMLSEDVICIRNLPEPHVVPGPAVLRVRPATAERIEVVDVEEVGIRDNRIHYSIAPERRGTCDPLPLRAILMLRESANGFRLERPAAADAVKDVWPLSFSLPSAEDRARCFAAITDLCRAVPPQNLYRPFRLEELPGLVGFVAEHV
jgi:hypothetical protein